MSDPIADAKHWEANYNGLLDQAQKMEKELVALRKYAHDATKAITGLTPGGSEYFSGKIGDIYIADLKRCVSVVLDSRTILTRQILRLSNKGDQK